MKKYIFTILCFAIALNVHAEASKTYEDLEVNACEDRSPGYANNSARMIENARRHAKSWCQFNDGVRSANFNYKTEGGSPKFCRVKGRIECNS